ncbi:MAG: hypothetical protein A2Y89_02690 [Chloroflexi bacterium RBG_13_51_18]|nr:MAG: hypothetical protein A2Y89_02690 [Chloroflexi bacterium RBG_13_51_18]
MTNGRHPCADGLTPECFKKYPEWAKMLFAQKLMGTLFPPEVTKNLPTAVQQAMGQPPPGWPADQPMPAALGLAPPPGIIVPAGGVAAPLYTAVGAAGGGGALAGRNVVAQLTPWFYDPFTTLDLTVWTEYNWGAATNTISAGRLKQTSPLATVAEIDSAANAGIPTDFDWSFDLTYDTDLGGSFYPYLYTGAHSLELEFDPPTLLRFRNAIAWQNFTVDTFLGTTDTWTLQYDGFTASLYRGTTAIFTELTPPIRLTGAGIIHLPTEEGTIYLDNLKIAAPYAAGSSACD